ncbi:MAG TPA: glycine cleavage T C-terminal barrel domain-containing protein [Vicinamibacterales bacterium]|nr:glycine cleavage T C-terminal barrel domain-containing protein [Vicinamibacterales bacterium]
MDDIATQYRTIIDAPDGAGWIERTDRGRLRFDGADRIPFLHALLTNDVAGLAPGSGTLALYLTPQGRTITDLHVFVRPDDVLADVPAALAARLAIALDSLIFAEDVRVTDVSASTAQISVVGPRAVAVLSQLAGTTVTALKQLAAWSHVPVPNGFVVRTDDFAVGSWDLLVEAAEMPGIRQALAHHRVVPMTDAFFETIRIEAGRPRFGVDFTEETIPLEAGLLDRAISRTKGCYVGQEVIIRVLDRGAGRVARRLVRLSIDPGPEAPPAEARILVEGRDVGRITSVSRSPHDAGSIALGYVTRDTAESSPPVTLAWADRTATARITGLAG